MSLNQAQSRHDPPAGGLCAPAERETGKLESFPYWAAAGSTRDSVTLTDRESLPDQKEKHSGGPSGFYEDERD
jgi:hypothetical protein